MKILFIQQNGLQESIGIANISALLKSDGHQCDLILLSHTKDLFEEIKKLAPDLIAFSALTGIHQSIISIATQIKKFVQIPIVMGGPHPTYCPDVLKADPLDIICIGEGELAMQELVNTMQQGKDIRQIQNLHVKDKNGTIHKNDLRPPADLNALPLPDREIYYKYTFIRDMPMKRFITSMGCPYPCTFCHEPIINKMYHGKYARRKSVGRVIEEVQYVQKRSPLKFVHFSDDIFIVGKKDPWLQEFAEAFPTTIGLPFSCNLRFDNINEDSVRLLHKAGCRSAAVGLESGSERLREMILNKKLKNNAIIAGAQTLKQYGIKILTTNMLGLPGETLDEAFETLELNMTLRTHYTRACTLMLFPELPITEYAKNNGLIDTNFDITKHESSGLEITLKSPIKKELTNLCCLFWIFSFFSPKWIPFFKKIVRLPQNAIFRMISMLSLIQEILFYRIPFIPGLKFFYNTIIKSSNAMTLRNIPSASPSSKN